MPKENLKDKVEGNVLDMSLSDLTTVPVKTLACIPKATVLDLSCNLLTTLPDEFSRLSHLVNIDLSKNRLEVLPETFGLLPRLQRLDLFSNRLRSLPLSFQYAGALKWLDVKDNPLEEPLKSRVGDCLDNAQCRQCAQQVIALMKQVESERERQNQLRLTQERELKASERAERERSALEEKRRRREEKEVRRRAYEEARAAEKDADDGQQVAAPRDAGDSPAVDVLPVMTASSGFSCLAISLALLVAIVAVVVGSYFYCQGSSHKMCKDALRFTNESFRSVRILLDSVRK